jgi:hypothetical protein
MNASPEYVYLVWTGYEDVEAVFRHPEDAERCVCVCVCVCDYIRDHPTYRGKLRTRSDFSIIRMELK